MRILVVEDEKKIATYVERGLKEFGFVVEVVHRGDEALEIIPDQRFDAVVYLAKPFSIDELAARLRALIRRNSGETIVRYRVSDLALDLATRVVRRGSRRIELTAREFSVLECLMRSPGRVFTRTQLCQHVWEYHFDPETNLVDVYIQRLRRKVDDGEATKLIQTVRGVGYRIGDLT